MRRRAGDRGGGDAGARPVGSGGSCANRNVVIGARSSSRCCSRRDPRRRPRHPRPDAARSREPPQAAERRTTSSAPTSSAATSRAWSCYGARVSLLVGGVTMLLTSLGGIVIGLVAGYYRRLDLVVMRFTDGLMAFPAILLAIAFMAARGPGVWNVILALSLVYMPRTALLDPQHGAEPARARLRAGGAGAGAARPRGVAFRHILPNCLAPLLVQGTFIFAYAVLAEAILGFLGVGRAALRALVGQRDRQRQERDPRGLLGEPVPRPRAHGGRAQPESPRRRPARHARPAAARHPSRKRIRPICFVGALDSRLTYSKYASPAAFGRRLAAGPFSTSWGVRRIQGHLRRHGVRGRSLNVARVRFACTSGAASQLDLSPPPAACSADSGPSAEVRRPRRTLNVERLASRAAFGRRLAAGPLSSL